MCPFKEIELANANQFKMFKPLCGLTQHKIIYEKGILQSFAPGELAMDHHIRSPWNWKGNAVYRNAKPVIQNLEADASKIQMNKDGTVVQRNISMNCNDTAYQSLVKKIKMVDGRATPLVERIK